LPKVATTVARQRLRRSVFTTWYLFHEPCLTWISTRWFFALGESLPKKWQPWLQLPFSWRFHRVRTVTTLEYAGA
jgi:hypothetical protein